MSAASHSIINADEAKIIGLLSAARRRWLYMAPGVTKPIAEAIAERWRSLGESSGSVILDMDPEVYRLGYGTLEGLKHLQEAAAEVGTLICRHQEGVRIGLLISDDRTLIFTPTPLLIEAGSSRYDHPNAIELNLVPDGIERDVGMGPEGAGERKIGVATLKPADIAKTTGELEKNPPAKFDIIRKVRVFTSLIEFVELRLSGCYVSRKTASIPAELLGLASDPKLRSRMRSTFKVISEDDVFASEPAATESEGSTKTPEQGDICPEPASTPRPPAGKGTAPETVVEPITEKSLTKERKDLEDTYLNHLKGFGSVILCTNKAEFKAGVARLEARVAAFKNQVEEWAGSVIERNRATLVEFLLPSVEKNFPLRWRKTLGPNPTAGAIRERLDTEIGRALGTAGELISDMKVEVVFKAVTFEMLQSEEFLKVACAAFPNFTALHSEYEAARAAGPPPTSG